MNKQTKIDNIESLQNVAAISGSIHGDKRYHEFYDALPEGSGSVYSTVIALAQELTAWEAANTPEDMSAYEAFDTGWYEVVDAIADGAIKSAIAHGYVDERAVVRAAVDFKPPG